MEKKLVIIKNKVMDITNLGWNPTQCNKKVVDFVGERNLKHSSFYFDKELNLYEIDDLAIKHNLPLFSDKLWSIIERDYQAVWIQADRFFTRRSKFLKQYLKYLKEKNKNGNKNICGRKN